MVSITINKKATMTNVKQLLKQYPHYVNLAKRCNLANLHAVNFDSVKVTNSNTNNIDARMTRYIAIKERLTTINNTLDKIPVYNGKEVLKLKYCLPNPLTINTLMQRFYVSRRTLYKIMDSALLEFAELYPLEDLIVFDEE